MNTPRLELCHDRSVRYLTPSWSGTDVYLTPEHQNILKLTKDIEGKLVQYCTLFRGDARQFFEQHAISPTMVFLDGGHAYKTVKRDIEVLSHALARDVPVLCHDYLHTKRPIAPPSFWERIASKWRLGNRCK